MECGNGHDPSDSFCFHCGEFSESPGCPCTANFPAPTLQASSTGGGLNEITCRTRERIGEYTKESTLEILIDGCSVATSGVRFMYVSLWSAPETWGAAFAPTPGESLTVPAGLNLLVDVEDTGALDLVIVDGGSIIFPCEPEYPSHLSNPY